MTSIVATDVVHRGIELLGGNGTIETFSPLPRLYRDAIVYESWEGTHNVLCAQVHRDCMRRGLLDPFLDWVRRELATAQGDERDVVDAALEELEPRLRRSVADPAHGAVHFRDQLGRLTRIVQAACLLGEAAGGPSPEKTGGRRGVRPPPSPARLRPRRPTQGGAASSTTLLGADAG